MKTILNVFLYGGLDKAQYKEIRPLIEESNRSQLRVITAVAAAIFSILYATSLFTPQFQYSRDMNMTGMFVCWSAYIIMHFIKDKYKTNPYIIGYFLVALGYTYGIIIATQQIKDVPAITFACLTALLPLIFTDVPWRHLLAMMMGGASFLYMSHAYNSEQIYLINLENVIPLANFSAVLCIILTCNTYRRVYHAYLSEKKVKQQAETDQLTQVYNRNKLRSLLDEKGKRIKEIDEGVDVTVLLLDIDFFKKVNDTYGHDAGDAILKFTANQVRSCVKEADYVIRWGGEEFVVLLWNTPLNKGIETAEKIRSTIQKTENGICPITVSIGVSIYDGEDMEHTIKRADEKLYEAKENGRNQVRAVNISCDF